MGVTFRFRELQKYRGDGTVSSPVGARSNVESRVVLRFREREPKKRAGARRKYKREKKSKLRVRLNNAQIAFIPPLATYTGSRFKSHRWESKGRDLENSGTYFQSAVARPCQRTSADERRYTNDTN